MKVPFLNLDRSHSAIKTELEEAMKKVLNSGWFIGGEEVEKFENEFARYIGAKHCVGCGNGTDALELILKAFDNGPGDEVIVPSFTWVSDAEAVVNAGATPVFAEIDSDSYTISIDSVRSKITPKTKAIIAVHLYGSTADLIGLKQLCKEHNLKLIEDCAQAHGALHNGRKVGSIGDAAAFSFYPTKNLGALGDGGAITTNNKEFANKIKLIANHGQLQRDQHELIGRNSRLDPIQAAILSIKLNYLDQWNRERERLAKIYLDELKDLSIKLPRTQPGRVFHLFVIALQQRDELKSYLESKGVHTAIHYPKAIHQIPVYVQFSASLPNSEKAPAEVLSLPIYPGLKEEEVRFVAGEIRRFLEKKVVS